MQGYDYSYPCLYFVTICTDDMICCFGDVMCDIGGEYSVALTDMGKIAVQCWRDIPNHYPCAILDEWIVMPNHVHGIIEISDDVDEMENLDGDECRIVGVQNPEPTWPQKHKKQNKRVWHKNEYQKIIPRSLGAIICGFKIGVTKWCNQNNHENFKWQRNFYEQIIRDDK